MDFDIVFLIRIDFENYGMPLPKIRSLFTDSKGIRATRDGTHGFYILKILIFFFFFNLVM